MVPSPLHEKRWRLVQRLVDRYLAAVVGSSNTAAARFAKEVESNGSALIAAEKRIDPDYEQEEDMLSFEESSYGTTKSSVAGQDTRRSLRAFEAPVQPSSSPVPSESSTNPVGISPDFSWHYRGDTGSSVIVEISNSESLDHLKRKAQGYCRVGRQYCHRSCPSSPWRIQNRKGSNGLDSLGKKHGEWVLYRKGC